MYNSGIQKDKILIQPALAKPPKPGPQQWHYQYHRSYSPGASNTNKRHTKKRSIKTKCGINKHDALKVSLPCHSNQYQLLRMIRFTLGCCTLTYGIKLCGLLTSHFFPHCYRPPPATKMASSRCSFSALFPTIQACNMQ